MPRANIGKPQLLKDTEHLLREKYPLYMRLSDISAVTGIKNYRILREFVADLTVYQMGHTQKWRRDDIARRIYLSATESR